MEHDQFDPPEEEESREYYDYDHANWIVTVVFIVCVTAIIIGMILTNKGN
jgi:hypothetical protein